MNILGINAYHGNASAAIVCDGKLIAAVEEERFNRVKYAAGFPAAAIRYCLAEAGLTPRKFITSPFRAIPTRVWRPSFGMPCACPASLVNAPKSS
jgi:predicted NodU family carbamoyl transferase